MKQIFQNLKDGQTQLMEIPAPKARKGTLLIKTKTSLISAGTERMLVAFGKSNWIDKAKSQPDKVKQVIEKIHTDGLMPTLDAVKSKLETPLPLGYSNVGTVIEVGDGVTGFSVGDTVLSNGNHSEIVCVPTNLCAKVPKNLSCETAAFGVVGSIALQGIRILNPTMGETIVVTGLGLIGLVAVQLLKANGCKVIGIDYDASKCQLAEKFGATTVNMANGENPLDTAAALSGGKGVDGVLITAATASNEPVSQAARMCRKRGRIVLVGVTGLNLSRADFYEKELSFQVSCSYGPGRYDENYEQKGNDYPIGFVRWTEQRNFETVLYLMSQGLIDVSPLITHRYDFSKAPEAYELLTSREKYLGIILNYAGDEKETLKNSLDLSGSPEIKPQKAVLGVIGAGNYAGRVLIPAFSKTSAVLHTISSSQGAGPVYFGKKFGFGTATTDSKSVLESKEINTVVISTRHDSHAHYVLEAIKQRKNIFVEKPLALTQNEIDSIEEEYKKAGKDAPLIMVGFNRRFSPQIQKMKTLLSATKVPKTFIYTVNAGDIPANHWTQDPTSGGGRVIGEACHFIDLMRFLAGSKITAVHSTFMGDNPAVTIRNDKATITVSFEDGSIGTVHYFANGAKSFPKERLEVFCGGAILQLDNFRKLTGYGWKGFSKMNLWSQDKGQNNCTKAFVDAIENGKVSPIPFDEIIEVSRATIKADIQEQNR